MAGGGAECGVRRERVEGWLTAARGRKFHFSQADFRRNWTRPFADLGTNGQVNQGLRDAKASYGSPKQPQECSENAILDPAWLRLWIKNLLYNSVGSCLRENPPGRRVFWLGIGP